VDCSTSVAAALHVCGYGHTYPHHGSLAIVRTRTDIFPNIDIPVVSIIWNYNGLVPEDMSNRVVSVTERALTTTVDNIEHIESQSLYGVAVVKVFLQPNANSQAQ
jgi:multidrug efflux pump subunit AcrB